MLKILSAILRLIAIVIIILGAWLLVNTFYYLASRQFWNKIICRWALLMQKATGVSLERVGKTNSKYELSNHLVIANHTSWLDIIILYSLHAISFVGKIEMKRWPVLNAIIKAGNTIFINRQNKRDILKANLLISQQLAHGRCIGFFPEGKVTNGQQIMPFKAPLLEAAILAKSTIIPVILIYLRKDGSFASEAMYDSKNLWQTVTSTLMLNGLTAKAIILPAVNAGEFSTRHQLAHFLHDQMSQVFRRERQQLKLAQLISQGSQCD